MDPIAVDFPGRAPAAAPRTTIPPVKVDSPRVEPPAETPTTTPPPDSNGWPKKAAAAFGFGLTKRRLAVTAAAVASLAAGIFAVKTFGPAIIGGPSEPHPTSPPASLPLASKTPKPAGTAPPDDRSIAAAASELPREPDAAGIPRPAASLESTSTAMIPPVVSVIPAAGPATSTASTTGESPLPLPLPLLPSESLASPAAVPPLPLPAEVTPVAAPSVLPVAASESKTPSVPAVPGIPDASTTPSATPPASPALPLPVPVTPEAALPATLPMSPAAPGNPATPASPASLPSPLPLPSATPAEMRPATPTEPSASAPAAKLPEVTPVTPVTPEATIPSPPVTPATPPDSLLPMPRPMPEAKLPVASPSTLPASVSPMSPAASPSPPSVEFRKPGETEPKTAGVAERAPTTSYDVDLYEPRAGESYESISREFYKDVRYARALAEFNQRRPLTGRGPVEVPPIHILKKRYPQFLGSTASTPATGPEWVPASGTSTGPSANARTAGSPTFVVPQGGMSMPDVAKRALGTDKRWREIYDLNPQFAPDAVPAGAELRLPSNTVAPK